MRAVTLKSVTVPGFRRTGPTTFNSLGDALRFVAEMTDTAEATGKPISIAFTIEDVTTKMLTVVSYATLSYIEKMSVVRRNSRSSATAFVRS